MTQDFEIKDNEVVIKKDEKPVSEDLENMSYHSAMNLINDPKFLPTTTFGELIPMLQKLYKDGANWQKEQMMKDAVDGFISNDLIGKFLHFDTLEFNVAGLKFQEGDKVKIIIVKE